MSTGSKVTDVIARHPKVAGALLAILLLLSQIGMVVANNASTNVGP